MSDTEKEVTTTEENRSNNTVTETGGSATTEQKVERTFTQQELDRIVKQAKADAKASAKREFDETHKGKIVLTQEEYSSKRLEWESEYKKSAAISSAKASIKSEYDLTDEQVARLIGDTAEDLQKDADKIYGALKKKDAPKLPTGKKTSDTDDDVIGKALKDLVQKRK